MIEHESPIIGYGHLECNADRNCSAFGGGVASTCSLAGALYGDDGIPAKWRERIAMHDEILAMADRLSELSGHA